MGFSSALLGGSIGFAAQCFSNYAMKIPLSRKPWMHVFLFTVGCYAGNKYPKVEQRLVEQTNLMRARNGLPPLIGTKGWIRYQPAAEEQK